MIITLQLKQVGFYVVSSAGEVLESTHINIVVGQWISERYINHLFLQRLSKKVCALSKQAPLTLSKK